MLSLRLKYYGIKSGDRYFVTLTKYDYYEDDFTISYYGKELLTVYITKMR